MEPHLTETEIAGYLGHDLSEPDRHRVEGHLDGCRRCRSEVVVVHQLEGSFAGGKRRSRRWMIPAGLVAAAALALLVVRGTPSASPTGPVERPTSAADGARALTVVSPAEGRSATADGLRFVWRPARNATYRFALLAADGTPVWTAETGDTLVALPGGIALVPEATYFWRVDAVRDGLIATTGAVRFSVAR